MSPKRIRGDGSLKEDDKQSEVRSPFVKDSDKIIYSSAFRRLKDKTQVHTFPGSDYVRTRLTHSLEVSSVGRTLGMALGRYLQGQKKINPNGREDPPDPADLGNVVAAACLAHDIGNPPFGHSGEEAIRHWFEQETEDIKRLLEPVRPEEINDLKCFDGNAQGFRILTRLQAWREEGGLRLTCATLGVFQKYPRGSYVTNPITNKKGPWKNKKFGYMQEDRNAFKIVAGELGLISLCDDDGIWCRHPLAFLLEAADDICNAISDIEDGYKYKKIDFDKAKNSLRNIALEAPPHWKTKDIDLPEEKYNRDEIIGYLRAQAIGVLIGQTIEVYKQREGEIMAGEFVTRESDGDMKDGNLMDEVTSLDELETIKELCKENLFHDESTLRAELAGFEVIRGLLEIYTTALKAFEKNQWKPEGLSSGYSKAFELLKKSTYIPEDRYEWLLRVIDYTSGMTDNYAVDLYRRLKGITVGEPLR